MGGGRIQKAGSACQSAAVAAPAAVPEPGRPDPLLVSHQFVPPAATAAQLGRLAQGGRLAAAVADLQRYRGNRYVGHVVQAIQRPAGGPGGRTVPERVRGPLERSLGSDFSAVRVHTDSSADRLARTLGAVAFTPAKGRRRLGSTRRLTARCGSTG
jgi:hypothetical protein